ncbi:MAG: class I lanthipeptide [Rikenellaceae bacterium]|jgi:hypothetical protein|nr:class I lanthipeptide [Rikenellaceae bacterium]
MEKKNKKKLTKLSLKKEVVSVLSKKDQANVQGGGFTTFLGDCQSRFTCCVLPTSCALSTDCPS